MAITYQDVVTAINTIIAAGETPSIPKIRNVLGDTGSPNTIHKHLNTWKATAAPAVQRKPPELPDDLQFALIHEIERQVAAARVDIDKELAQANSDLDLLSNTGEKLEEEIASVKAENTALHDEKQKLVALVGERKEEIERLTNDLKAERENAENARIKLAQELNKKEILESTVVDLKAEVQALKGDIQALTTERNQQEKQSAVLQSKLESEVEKNAAAVSRSTALEMELKDARHEFDAELKKLRSSFEEKIERLVAESKSKEAEVEKKAESNIANLREQLAHAEGKNKELTVSLSESEKRSAELGGRLSEIEKSNAKKSTAKVDQKS
jgi:colicin import membrane protein